MPPLLTPHTLSRLASVEAPSKIEVKNLQTVLPLTDAWGRPATKQPALISASISLRHPLSSSPEDDALNQGTVNYGILSKEILQACSELESIIGSGDEEGLRVPMWARTVVTWIHFRLTGHEVFPQSESAKKGPQAHRALKKTKKTKPVEHHLLSSENITLIEIEVVLPKASLLGSGVSVKGAFAYEDVGKGPGAYSMVLRLHDLRIPAIIGINPNERLAKQVVICSVEMEKWDREDDAWAELEEIIAKTIEESTFQTLEALSTHLTTRILTLFLLPSHPHSPNIPSPIPQPISISRSPQYPQIRLRLSKPTAVTPADFPTVEMLTDTDPATNELAKSCWRQLGSVKKPPFPLQGQLNGWLTMQGFENYRDEF